MMSHKSISNYIPDFWNQPSYILFAQCEQVVNLMDFRILLHLPTFTTTRTKGAVTGIEPGQYKHPATKEIIFA